MPSQRFHPAPLGGVTSRRHAKLLLHLVESSGGGASVKDLRLRRVVPPASVPPLDSSPDCAAAKPRSVESTPPEATASAAAATEDRERKPMLPRSKLVRDPGSFGYRRLLPFLNQMVKSDNTNGKDMPSQNTAANSKKEFNTSQSGLVDESVDGADPIDSLESLVVKTGVDQEAKDCCDGVKEEIKIVPGDPASSKPWLTRSTRSRFIHHPSSFSYKRMLPFLMENEISPQEGDRVVKFRRVLEEKQLTSSDDNDVLASGHHHLAISKDSPEECNGAEVERTVEEKTSISDGYYVLHGEQLQFAVAEISPLDGSTAQVHKVTQEVLASDEDPLSSDKSELTSDGNDVLNGGQRQLAVSEDSPEESNVAEVERIVEETTTKSDENSVLDSSNLRPTVSEVSPQEAGTVQMQKATQKPALTSDGDEAKELTSDKGEFLAKEQPQPCDTELLKDNAKLTEVHQCQSSESGCSDVGFGSPTKTVMVDGGADRHGALEWQDSVASLDGPLLDVRTICRPSYPCAVGIPLSADELPGLVMHAESGSRKVRTLQPCGAPCLKKQGLSPKKVFPFNGAPCLEKRGPSPKKLSPKKGILKMHSRGCKGICMCLDCSIFRLRADRAFEFSRKQMQEADDIIGNLLKEVASLRSLTEKSSGQEQMEAACQRASRVEEVARERRRQMLMELNSHCKIPGPRVKFAQYVEERMASSPRSSSSRR